jgi:hypothetical protein
MYDPYNPYETQKPGIEVNFKSHRGSKKKNGIGTVNAGGAIIIIIFVVLCLTIFGLLSFTTSFADKKLADKNLRSVEQYYKADSEAEQKLAMIYDAVNSQPKNGTDYFFDEYSVVDAVSSLSMATDLSVSDKDGGVSVSYQTVMGDYSEDETVKFYLNSEVIFYYDTNANKLSYKISTWKVVFNSDLDYDNDFVDVWGGFDW